MKRCVQCGKEYPDDILICAVDQQPLQQIASSLPIQNHKKSDFISLETMLVWAIAGIAIFIVIVIVVSYILVNFGLARDHGM